MGQKINPHGFRVGINKNWSSRWIAKKQEIPVMIKEDNVLRKLLKKKLYNSGVSKIEIERDNSKVKIFIFCAKPGIIIGRSGSEIEKTRLLCEKITSKLVSINIVEVKNSDENAQLIAENIAAQLEKRISYRRALKQAMTRTMKQGNIKGIKLQVGGRLGGAEIARSEHYHEGSVPLQTIRADIDYGFAEAATNCGKIGIKAWFYKGEIFKKRFEEPTASTRPSERPKFKRILKKEGITNAFTKENKI